MAKPKVAFYWCASCGGCEETVVDLAEDILKVVAAVDIVLWPVAMDFKLKDVKAWQPGEVAVAFKQGTSASARHDGPIRIHNGYGHAVVVSCTCGNHVEIATLRGMSLA